MTGWPQLETLDALSRPEESDFSEGTSDCSQGPSGQGADG